MSILGEIMILDVWGEKLIPIWMILKKVDATRRLEELTLSKLYATKLIHNTKCIGMIFQSI
jgi:hypothetical protein